MSPRPFLKHFDQRTSLVVGELYRASMDQDDFKKLTVVSLSTTNLRKRFAVGEIHPNDTILYLGWVHNPMPDWHGTIKFYYRVFGHDCYGYVAGDFLKLEEITHEERQRFIG